ncbi:29443_t:CDS:2, partial [Racocetra persica]
TECEVAQPTEEEPSSPKIVSSSSQPTRKYSTRTGVAKERDKNLNTKIRAKALRPKKRKRLENNQTIFISKKKIKTQQTNSETLVAEKKSLPLSLLKPNTSEITLQNRTTLGQPNLEHTSRLSENWADEFEEVSRTQHRVQLNSTMVNNKELKNSLANSYKTKADREMNL